MTPRHLSALTRRALAVAATATAIAVAIAVAISSSSDAAAPTPARATRVLAVGDSVMEGAAPALRDALPGRQLVIDTEVSRSTGAGADAALAHGTGWDVVVVLLGHNDGASATVYQPAYRRLLSQLRHAPRIVVLTLHEVRPYYPGVNAFLRAEAAARPNVRVADWNAVVSRDPGATAADGLHLSGAGARLLARLVAGAVGTAESDVARSQAVATRLRVVAARRPPMTTAPTATTVVTRVARPVGLAPIAAGAMAWRRAPSTTDPGGPERARRHHRSPMGSPMGSTQPAPASGSPDGADAAPLAVGPLLVAAWVTLAAVLVRIGRRLPR